MQTEEPQTKSGKNLMILHTVVLTSAFLIVCTVKVLTYKPSAAQRTLNGWAKQEYTPIDQSAAFKEKILKLPIRSSEPLTALQEESIHRAAYDMTMAFYSNSYDDYRKFRVPLPPKGYDTNQVEIFRRYCQSNWKNPDHQVPDDPEGIFKKMWEVVFVNKYVRGVVKNSTIGKPFWDAVALQQSEIVVTQYQGMPPPLFRELKESVGSSLSDPTFVFTNTPEDILQRSGKLTCAVVRMLVEHPKPEPRAPVYCRFYWDDDSGVWLPISFCTPFNLTRTRNYVF